jgi:cytochrome c
VQKLGLFVLAGVILVAVNVAAGDGAAVFESQRCGICHKPDISKTSPSLKEIALAYHGKGEHLIKYLKGEAEPVIETGKANMMKGALVKAKALSDVDRKALADFIMGH